MSLNMLQSKELSECRADCIDRGSVSKWMLVVVLSVLFLSVPSVPEAKADALATKVRKMFLMPTGTEPMVRDAARFLVHKKGKAPKARVDAVLAALMKEPAWRILFAAQLINEGFRAIKSKRRTAAQRVFYKHFQRYFAQHQKQSAMLIWRAWKQYKRLAKPLVVNKPNGYPTMSVLMGEKPLDLTGFKPPANTLKVGPRGRGAIAILLSPMFAQDLTKKKVPGLSEQAIGGILITAGLVGTGVGTALFLAVGGALTTSFSAAIQFAASTAIAVKAATDAAFAAAIAAKATVAAANAAGAAAGATVAANAAAGAAGATATVVGGVFSTVAVGALIAAPMLIVGIVRVVGVVRNHTFEEKLKKAAEAPLTIPKLDQILFHGREDSGALCYNWCRKGFTGVGPVCWQTCPKGYTNDGATCRRPSHIYGKHSYTRKSYPLWQCKGKQKQGALCYPWCKKGYKGVGPVCWGTCKKGYKDDGATCRKPLHIFGRQSYGRGVGKVGKKCVKANLKRTYLMSAASYMIKMFVGDPADRGVVFTSPYVKSKPSKPKKPLVASKAPTARRKPPVVRPPVGLLPNGRYKMEIKHGGQRFVTHAGAGYGNANVQTEKWKGWNTQQWLFHRVGNTPYYKIETYHGRGRFLTQVGTGYGTANVRLERWKGWNTQYWRLIRVGAGPYYKIVLKHGHNRYLTQAGSGYGVANIQVEKWKGWNTQYWRIHRMGQ